MRLAIPGLAALLAIGVGTQAGRAAEVVQPDVIVDITRARPTHRLVETSRLELAYGDAPGAIGFEPAGDERRANGPDAFEVDARGDYIVADPVHRVLLRVALRSKVPVVSEIGALPLRGEAPAAFSSAVRVTKCNAEAGLVSVAPGGKQIQVEVGGPLASIRLIGVSTAGDIFLIVERFIKRGKLAVDRQVVVLDSSGALKALLQVRDKPAVHPGRDFVLGPKGTLHRMVPGTQAVAFVRFEVRP
ncbi:MAG TPA: hypothetical protein VM425_11085 [Myxococcota bacterium]|nr:hypothetical protein [Myxococcota bacterium]